MLTTRLCIILPAQNALHLDERMQRKNPGESFLILTSAADNRQVIVESPPQ